MGKRLEFDDQARAALQRGVEQLAGAVRVTLGPRPLTVALAGEGGAPTLTRDGATIAEAITLADPFEDLGARLVRDAASRTREAAGDGATTAMVLTHALVSRGLHAIAAGHDAVALRRGVERAAEAALAHLAAAARPLAGPEELRRMAATAAGGDAELGTLAAEALAAAGAAGVVRVVDAPGPACTLEVVEGLRVPAGWASAYFVTDPPRQEAALAHPLVLLAAVPCTAARDLVPALELAARARRPLLVVAPALEGEALALLVVNRLRGTAPCAGVLVPGRGTRRRAWLEDLAVLTGARVLEAGPDGALARAGEADLGRAGAAVVGRAETVVIQGGGRSEVIRDHLRRLDGEAGHAGRERARAVARERLTALRGGVAVIRAGGADAATAAARRGALEGALNAARAALAEGVVTGGGVALARARDAVRALPRARGADEQHGRDLVAEALEAPARQIAENVGADGTRALEHLHETAGREGFDAVAGRYADLDAAGILDPLAVTRAALQNAARVGAMVLTTDALVVEEDGEDGGDEAAPEA